MFHKNGVSRQVLIQKFLKIEKLAVELYAESHAGRTTDF